MTILETIAAMDRLLEQGVDGNLPVLLSTTDGDVEVVGCYVATKSGTHDAALVLQ